MKKEKETLEKELEQWIADFYKQSGQARSMAGQQGRGGQVSEKGKNGKGSQASEKRKKGKKTVNCLSLPFGSAFLAPSARQCAFPRPFWWCGRCWKTT
ncbi:MAG: hypothetical protein Q4E86_13025 [Lachnospiraceae bacterium]|nr:hypothetical protein [Lachnospiraceae bacterium]